MKFVTKLSDPTRVSNVSPKAPNSLQSTAIQDQTTGKRGDRDILLSGAKEEPLLHPCYNSPRHWIMVSKVAGTSAQQEGLKELAQ